MSQTTCIQCGETLPAAVGEFRSTRVYCGHACAVAAAKARKAKAPARGKYKKHRVPGDASETGLHEEWECTGCGGGLLGSRPVKCEHCGGAIFTRCRQPVKSGDVVGQIGASVRLIGDESRAALAAVGTFKHARGRRLGMLLGKVRELAEETLRLLTNAPNPDNFETKDVSAKGISSPFKKASKGVLR